MSPIGSNWRGVTQRPCVVGDSVWVSTSFGRLRTPRLDCLGFSIRLHLFLCLVHRVQEEIWHIVVACAKGIQYTYVYVTIAGTHGYPELARDRLWLHQITNLVSGKFSTWIIFLVWLLGKFQDAVLAEDAVLAADVARCFFEPSLLGTCVFRWGPVCCGGSCTQFISVCWAEVISSFLPHVCPVCPPFSGMVRICFNLGIGRIIYCNSNGNENGNVDNYCNYYNQVKHI